RPPRPAARRGPHARRRDPRPRRRAPRAARARDDGRAHRPPPPPRRARRRPRLGAGRRRVSLADLLAFALGAIRGHRVRTALTLLGMAIGVAAVVLLAALGEGARRYVMQQFEAIGSNMLAVVPGKTETTGVVAFASVTTRDLTLGDVEAIRRRIPEAELVAPISMGSETVSYQDRRRQVG